MPVVRAGCVSVSPNEPAGCPQTTGVSSPTYVTFYDIVLIGFVNQIKIPKHENNNVRVLRNILRQIFLVNLTHIALESCLILLHLVNIRRSGTASNSVFDFRWSSA